MFKSIVMLTVVCVLTACQTPNTPTKATTTPAPHGQTSQTDQVQAQKQETVLIVFFETDKKPSVLNAIKTNGDRLIYDYHTMSGVAIATSHTDVEGTMAFYRKIAGVLSVELDKVVSLH